MPLLPSFSVSVRSHAELNHQVALLAVGDCSYEPLAGIALTMKLVECASTIINNWNIKIPLELFEIRDMF